jgi:16S rRNA (adenine1518-N6/adenine1519-N6)-dimethyltransferase
MKRRRLGQHYLVDQDTIDKIVDVAKIGPSERVVEIGTGKGALTRALVHLGGSYLGFEVDRRNFEETARLVAGTRAQVRLADAFEEAPEFDVLVASLPYSESSTFVEWLSGIEFDRAVVVLQEDFVEKILAPPGDRNYRGISALSQLAFDVQVVEHVGRDSFSPQPRVSSVIARFSPRRRVEMAEVASIMRLFSLRRRRVDSALAKLGMKWKSGQGTRRVYSLKPEEVHEICGA